MAMITIARPASKARPTLLIWRALRIVLPRPGPSMSEVITTIERAIMIVWLMPRMIVRRAIGSWTFVRSWRPVDPSDVAASTVVGRDAPDAEGGDPDRRRDRVDHRRDRGARGADQEEQRDPGQVRERRHDLHEVEDRPDRVHEPLRAARGDAERDADRQRQDDRGEGQGERLHAPLPEAEDAERQEAGRHEPGQPPAAGVEADDGTDRRETGPGQVLEDEQEALEDRVDDQPHPGRGHDEDDVRAAVVVDPVADVVDRAERRRRRCRGGCVNWPLKSDVERRAAIPNRRTSPDDARNLGHEPADRRGRGAHASGDLVAGDGRQDLDPVDDADDASRLR